MSTRSDALRVKLDLPAPALRIGAARMWSTPPLAERYAEYLCVMHGVIRASVPLMQQARAIALTRRDAASAPLVEYLGTHIDEERGHDEWLRADLATIGFDPDEPLRRRPATVVAELVGTQYYWITHHDPVMLLGYIAVLEGYPPEPELVDRLAASTGLPVRGFRTLARHAELDPGHRADLDACLDGAPLTPIQTAQVEYSAMQTMAYCARLVEHIASVAPSVPRRAVAS